MSSILKITDPIPSDDSIDKYEHFEYEPVTGTNLNNSGGDIRIYIETQDLFYTSQRKLFTYRRTLNKGKWNGLRRC